MQLVKAFGAKNLNIENHVSRNDIVFCMLSVVISSHFSKAFFFFFINYVLLKGVLWVREGSTCHQKDRYMETA